MLRVLVPTCYVITIALCLGRAYVGFSADWPCLRGSPDHTGYVEATLRPPFRLVWAREFLNERLGTAMEPIVVGDKVFVATHGGNIYASDAATGEPIWRFEAHGPFMQSPAVANGWLVAASTDGYLYALNSFSGKLRWSRFVSRGGCSASPLIIGKLVLIGSRAGDFVCLNLQDGSERWKVAFAVPIRQTAAYLDGKVFVTGEDLRVRCLAVGTGKLLWTSEQLIGQTARDYYPIVVKAAGRTLVIVRTNPILNMGQRIGRDRTMLARNAGIEDSSWKKLEAWINSDASHGTPELWAKEQLAIIEYLEKDREARTFFVLDGATGKEAFTPPVLWIGGCQGVGAEPALTSDGRLLVFYRSAYGNWNQGVAPLVTLGLYDLGKNQITPVFHQQGKKPSWNCFWGTADESQNFVVAGDSALIVHQATLSGFDLKRNELFPIYGERDTYGGFRSPPWARNEWHGPARSGVAVVGKRIYWQTGSRILCLVSGEQGNPGAIATTKASDVKSETSPVRASHVPKIAGELAKSVEQILSKEWAPLFVDPGLAGRDFSFDDSSELFQALSWAYPHLSRDVQGRVQQRLAVEWTNHPPYTMAAFYSLKEGAPREPFWVASDCRARFGGDKQPHPFGGVYAALLYANRCGHTGRVNAAFAKIKESFESFEKTNWKLDPAKCDLFANRYLAALLAYAKLAQANHDASAAPASHLAEETSDALMAWWNRASATRTLTSFNGSAQLDPFITRGDAISYRIAPHRHKIALFYDLTPEVAALMRQKAPEAVENVWQTFTYLYATWYSVGEERQVHFGENFVDPPDLALSGFKALAWLRKADLAALNAKLDLPFCRADLYHVTKLALILDEEKRTR